MALRQAAPIKLDTILALGVLLFCSLFFLLFEGEVGSVCPKLFEDYIRITWLGAVGKSVPQQE